MMKQPSGPAVSASPTPATSALVKKSSSIGLFLAQGFRPYEPRMIVPAAAIRAVFVVMMVAVIGMAIVRHRTILMHDAAIRQMRMVMMMGIKRQGAGPARAEETLVFLALADHFGRAAAADMA